MSPTCLCVSRRFKSQVIGRLVINEASAIPVSFTQKKTEKLRLAKGCCRFVSGNILSRDQNRVIRAEKHSSTTESTARELLTWLMFAGDSQPHIALTSSGKRRSGRLAKTRRLIIIIITRESEKEIGVKAVAPRHCDVKVTNCTNGVHRQPSHALRHHRGNKKETV